jgi:soluble lytic murein transglycosylase-like protein
MTTNTPIQQTGLIDVRTYRKPSRLQKTVAGCSVASALLLGGLFGFHGSAHTALAASQQSLNTMTPGMLMRTAPMSYSVATDYQDLARQDAIDAGINPDYFVRQIQQESGFDPNAGSPAGAEGIAQFMPSTAASMGIDPYDPAQALNAAAQMMANLSAQYGGDYAKALAAYNAGSGAVDAAVAQGGGSWLSYLPSETQNYVSIIIG